MRMLGVRFLSPAPLGCRGARLPVKLNKRCPLEGFPSGQRDQTVNLTAQPSEVRILPPPFLKDEFNKLKFNITYKDIYKNIYLISTVKETLSDTKKIIDLYVKRFSNTKSTTIKQSDNSVLDTESLDKIADYIKYFNFCDAGVVV